MKKWKKAYFIFKKYFYNGLFIFSIIILSTLWFTDLLNVDIKHSPSYRNYEEKIDEIALSYAKRDIQTHFEKLAYLTAYDYSIKVINHTKIRVDLTKSLLTLLNGNDSKDAKKAIQYIEDIKKSINTYNHKQYLKSIYVFPYSADKYIYKIDVDTLKLYLINFEYTKVLRKDPEFIDIQFNKRVVFFNKEEVIKGYKEELLAANELTNKSISDLYNKVNKYVDEIIVKTKWVITCLYLIFWIIAVKAFEYIERIEDYHVNKQKYNESIYYSQHDLKTNSTVILNKLNLMYQYTNKFELIHDKNKDKARLNFLDCYAIEQTISNANDYAKQGSVSQYKVPGDLNEEKILKWCAETSEITLEIMSRIIDVDINLDYIENYVIDAENDKSTFYKDELSSAIFRLLNNAIKHKKRHSKINLYIGTCENKKLKIDIINEIISDEIPEEVLQKIKNSLNGGNQHNLPIVNNIISKYNLVIIFDIIKSNDENVNDKVIITLKEKEEESLITKDTLMSVLDKRKRNFLKKK